MAVSGKKPSKPDQDGPRLAGRPISEPDARLIGISRRIWAALAVLAVLVVAGAIGFFWAQGALEANRAALRQAKEKQHETEIALKHAIEARNQAIGDREQLLKELAAQGNRLADLSRGEERAKSALEIVSTGAEAAEKRIERLKAELAEAKKQVSDTMAKLNKATKDNVALSAELEIDRAALENAKQEVEQLRAKYEPYAETPAKTPSR